MKIQVQRPAALLQAEILISYVLRGGVFLCALVLAFGLGLQIFFPPSNRSETFRALLHGNELADYRVADSLHSFWIGLMAFNPETIISLGILLLIFLPILRVAMTVVIFILERDLIYFWITSVVLGLLLFGIVMGKTL